MHLRALGAPFSAINGPATEEACVPLGNSGPAYDYPVVFAQEDNGATVLFAQMYTDCNFDGGIQDSGTSLPVPTCQGREGPIAVWPQAPTTVSVEDASATADGPVEASGPDAAVDAPGSGADASEVDAGAGDAEGGGLDAGGGDEAGEGGS